MIMKEDDLQEKTIIEKAQVLPLKFDNILEKIDNKLIWLDKEEKDLEEKTKQYLKLKNRDKALYYIGQKNMVINYKSYYYIKVHQLKFHYDRLQEITNEILGNIYDKGNHSNFMNIIYINYDILEAIEQQITMDFNHIDIRLNNENFLYEMLFLDDETMNYELESQLNCIEEEVKRKIESPGKNSYQSFDRISSNSQTENCNKGFIDFNVNISLRNSEREGEAISDLIIGECNRIDYGFFYSVNDLDLHHGKTSPRKPRQLATNYNSHQHSQKSNSIKNELLVTTEKLNTNALKEESIKDSTIKWGTHADKSDKWISLDNISESQELVGPKKKPTFNSGTMNSKFMEKPSQTQVDASVLGHYSSRSIFYDDYKTRFLKKPKYVSDIFGMENTTNDQQSKFILSMKQGARVNYLRNQSNEADSDINRNSKYISTQCSYQENTQNVLARKLEVVDKQSHQSKNLTFGLETPSLNNNVFDLNGVKILVNEEKSKQVNLFFEDVGFMNNKGVKSLKNTPVFGGDSKCLDTENSNVDYAMFLDIPDDKDFGFSNIKNYLIAEAEPNLVKENLKKMEGQGEKAQIKDCFELLDLKPQIDKWKDQKWDNKVTKFDTHVWNDIKY